MGDMKTFPLLAVVFLSVMARAFAAYVLPAAPPEITGGGLAAEAVRTFRAGCPAAAADMAGPLAEKGDADACFLLAYGMEAREPAKMSRAQAMGHYYRRAGEAGHPEAGYRRSLISLTAGSEKERNDAREAFESAAAKDPRAGRILGEAWLRGFVTGKPDVSKAVEYWKAAGAKGDTKALILLARLHEGDFGFPELADRGKVEGYYRDAAGAGDGDAFVSLGSLLLGADRSPEDRREGHDWLAKALDRKMSVAWLVLGDHEQAVRKDETAAMDYYQKGAAAGDAGCMMRIAARSNESADRRSWLERASAAGSPAASAELGRQLMTGGSPDFPQARRYLILAAREGIPQAQYDLGMFYLEGRDGAPDPVAAMPWLTEAMKAGDAGMQYQLGTLHERGIGGPVNYANAGVLYTMACNKGHAAAATRIAVMAMNGWGTARDPAQAKAHALLALERGDGSARAILKEIGELDPEQNAKAEKAVADLRAMARTPQSGAQAR